MFGRRVSIHALASLGVALLFVAGTRAGGELTPEQRRAMKQEATRLSVQGVTLFRQGKLGEAKAPLEKSLALLRRLYREDDHANLAISLDNLGSLLSVRGDLAGAEKLYREALAMRRRLYPDADHADLAESLNNLGLLRKKRGDLAEAEMLVREALAMRRRLHPQRDHPSLAACLGNLGLLRSERGDLGGAEKLLREALAMNRRLYPKADHPALAYSLNNLAHVLEARGDLAGAENLCRDALALFRRLYPKGDRPELATGLNNLGSLRHARGDLAGAEEHYRQALAMFRRLLPPDADHPELALTLHNLGVVLEARGDLAGAEQRHRDALAMRRRLYPRGDHPHLAASLNSLGSLSRERGDLAGAEQLYRQAVEMLRRLSPRGDHPRLAAVLNNLGEVLRARRDLGGAEQHYREALTAYRRLYPDAAPPELAPVLNNLGSLLLARGDLAGAEKYMRQALALCRRLYPDADHPALAQSLNGLGVVLKERGDLAGADVPFREALAMNRRLYPDADHPALAQSLNNLGALLLQRGDRDRAEAPLREALPMYQRLLVDRAGLAAEAEALFLADDRPLSRDLVLSVTRGRADDPSVYDLLWQGRSALTRILEQRHRDLLADRDPDTRKLGDELLIARQSLARRLLAPVKNARQRAEEVRTLTAAKEDMEKQLTRRLRLEVSAASPPPRRLAELLPEGACFLDFYRYAYVEYGPAVKGPPRERRTNHYAAFVLTPGRPAVRVELGEAAPIERAWADWHKAITQDAPAKQERQAAAVLSKLVWAPIQKLVPKNARILYVTPDEALTRLPWAALPGARPDSVLLEEYAIAVVPHGPFLLDRLAAKGQARAAGGALLAVGDVDYHPPAKAPGQRGSWGKLPATRAEIERVAALAEKQVGVKARRLTGDDATTAGVLEELPKARYAHLATHGFFADAQFRSAFQVDPQHFGRRGINRQVGSRSPLVLSGLVFAGANRSGEEANEDRGILTAEGLVGLRLDKLELAVLSACNTGLGEVGDEGVYGLQRAFHIAGCKDVIASLWAVEDESTAALMTLFYSNLWQKKLGPLEALRQAQLYLYRNPQQVKQLARRDFEEVPLPREGANPKGPRARTAQWAAFTFSGVAAPVRLPR